jgi:DNA-binding response OmpR family regulator
LGLDLARDWLLFKPFTLAELERRVRQALES